MNPLFQHWLDEHFPDRAARVMARVREMRGGKDYDATFGTRMRGEGVWAELLAQRLAKAKRRFGLDDERRRLDIAQFRKPLAASRRARPTCSAERPAAQSATSGSKNNHCTCGKAARKLCSTRSIASTSARAESPAASSP